MSKEPEIIPFKLFYQEAPKESILKDQSIFLSNITKYNDFHFIGFGEDNVPKNSELELFTEIKPLNDNEFIIELATELPNLLPNYMGQSEYILEVPVDTKKTTKINLFVSNIMGETRYKIGTQQYVIMFPRNLETGLFLSPYFVPITNYIKILKTVTSCQFSVNGVNADDAIKNNIRKCIDTYLIILNKLLLSLNMMPEQKDIISTSIVYDSSTFDFMYIGISGINGTSDYNRILLVPEKSILLPPDYDENKSKIFYSYINGEKQIDDIEKILISSKNYLDGGLLEFAFLQLVIAAEISTSHFCYKGWEERGISKNKSKEFTSDITFSQMLNIHIFLLSPLEMQPNISFVGQVNAARKIRNKIVHESKFTLDKKEIEDFKNYIEKYIHEINKIYSFMYEKPKEIKYD
ncbi:MAG: hypothetical protein AABZ74_05510 [Cyanobacteriota bacterium]